ncbi:hypothetical protein [Nocardia paucivorans]|uniref:hypothetical protein n=1 Tax=Nocardia paucivorans TaxID=114259 RepID=UPI0002EB65B7|nr:hypothetical protein [Nocardia paucivorans]
MKDKKTTAEPEIDPAALEVRLEHARKRRELLDGTALEALVNAPSDDELTRRRELAERMRDLELRRQWRIAEAENKAADADLALAAELQAADHDDMRVARKAMALQRRSVDPRARMARLHRWRTGVTYIFAGVVVACVLISATTVQRNIAGDAEMTTIRWWAGFFFEATVSLILLGLMATRMSTHEWGEELDKTWAIPAEVALLATSIALNVGKYVADDDWGQAAVHAIPPGMMTVAVLLHTPVSEAFSRAMAKAHATVAELDAELRQAATVGGATVAATVGATVGERYGSDSGGLSAATTVGRALRYGVAPGGRRGNRDDETGHPTVGATALAEPVTVAVPYATGRETVDPQGGGVDSTTTVDIERPTAASEDTEATGGPEAATRGAGDFAETPLTGADDSAAKPAKVAGADAGFDYGVDYGVGTVAPDTAAGVVADSGIASATGVPAAAPVVNRSGEGVSTVGEPYAGVAAVGPRTVDGDEATATGAPRPSGVLHTVGVDAARSTVDPANTEHAYLWALASKVYDECKPRKYDVGDVARILITSRSVTPPMTGWQIYDRDKKAGAKYVHHRSASDWIAKAEEIEAREAQEARRLAKVTPLLRKEG